MKDDETVYESHSGPCVFLYKQGNVEDISRTLLLYISSLIGYLDTDFLNIVFLSYQIHY